MNSQFGDLCINCRFYQGMRSEPIETASGPCCRYAPAVVPRASEFPIRWPLVDGDAWCGEFQSIHKAIK